VSQRSNVCAARFQMLRLPISAKCACGAISDRELAMKPVDVNELSTASTPPGTRHAISSTKSVERDDTAVDTCDRLRNACRLRELPLVANTPCTMRDSIATAARPTPPAVACTRTLLLPSS
jgi:hypothetical protein